ncbi:MAG: hypothetical protein QXK06_02645 [Candidatus Diapherotrites archaeon]
MLLEIGKFKAILLEGTIPTNNSQAIIKKGTGLLAGGSGFLQCCSIEGVPSLSFARSALENTLCSKSIGKTKNKGLLFLLWLYCTLQLEKAIMQAARTEKGCLLVVAAKDKKKLKECLEIAKRLGFKEKKGIIGKNFRKNLEVFQKQFCISEKELFALKHLPKEKAIEALAIERQAMMAL